MTKGIRDLTQTQLYAHVHAPSYVFTKEVVEGLENHILYMNALKLLEQLIGTRVCYYLKVYIFVSNF